MIGESRYSSVEYITFWIGKDRGGSHAYTLKFVRCQEQRPELGLRLQRDAPRPVAGFDGAHYLIRARIYNGHVI